MYVIPGSYNYRSDIMDEEKEKMKTGRKVVLALILILLILTAAAYGYGVHYFTDHFLPGSQVNGFNCSYKTTEETENLLRNYRYHSGSIYHTIYLDSL